MSGQSAMQLKNIRPEQPQVITLTPEMAASLLEHNQLNRPLSDQHVKRIADQIISGNWKFNGDTIKVSSDGEVLDGQHRLWAIIEAKTPVETILVHGIQREAFSTIDTIRRQRSGADVLSLNGATRHRQALSTALTWLLRWQWEVLEEYRAPQNRVENSDIEQAFREHPGMIRAVERSAVLRRLVNTGLIAFIYYVFSNRHSDLAERMMNTLENPAGVGIHDPFFRLRAYFTADHTMKKDAIVTIALAIKAANAAQEGRQIQVLTWKHQGKVAEPFPHLTIG